MSGKNDKHADEREMESCLLLQKMDALDKLDNGMRITAVGGHNALNESTIQVIDKNKDQMRGSVKEVFNRVRTHLVQTVVTLSSKSWKDLVCIAGRRKAGMNVSHWYCGELDSHVVTQNH